MYVVSHVPGGFSDTMGGWGREFARVVSRFESTVVGQFYGHTHQDEFIVFYEPEAANARATNVAFISPSVATWTNLNPSYTIFTTDSETHVRHLLFFPSKFVDRRTCRKISNIFRDTCLLTSLVVHSHADFCTDDQR